MGVQGWLGVREDLGLLKGFWVLGLKRPFFMYPWGRDAACPMVPAWRQDVTNLRHFGVSTHRPETR